MSNLSNIDYKKENDLWGVHQSYKELNIYPIKLKDYKILEYVYKSIAFPKNWIPDRNILKMSYLKYILSVVQPSSDRDIDKDIISLLKYVTKNEDISVLFQETTSVEGTADFNLFVKIGNINYTEYDFDNIREIILEQCGIGVDYIEAYNPELEARLKSINASSDDDVDFMDEVLIFCSLLKKTIYEIEEYTLYQFKKHFERLMILEECELYKPLESAGFIKLKNGEIKHYMSGANKKTGRYDSILVSKEDYINNSDVFKS